MEDMSYWKEVWERKGNSDTKCLEELDGYEDTTADVQAIAKHIVEELDIKETDSVLEVACGAGGLAQYIKCANYVGVDYSASLVKRHIEILNNSVLHGEANNLIFKDKTFDKVICFGAFHYFPNEEYAKQAIKLGVIDYILKPVNIDEFKKVVDSTLTKIKHQDEQLETTNQNKK